jgi:hypothetical protein
LVKRAPLGKELLASDPLGLKQYYVYSPDITISLALMPLIICILLVCILIASMVFFAQKPPNAETAFFEKVLNEYFSSGTAEAISRPKKDSEIERLELLLGRFHIFAKQLQSRYESRPSIDFKDEYDVQDALHALLKLHWTDVIKEEYAPRYASKNSKIDFILTGLAVGIEVKMAGESLRDKRIADQLIIDIERYQTHPNCKHLIFLIYDPKGILSDPNHIKRDLESKSRSMGITVVISPTS